MLNRVNSLYRLNGLGQVTRMTVTRMTSSIALGFLDARQTASHAIVITVLSNFVTTSVWRIDVAKQ